MLLVLHKIQMGNNQAGLPIMYNVCFKHAMRAAMKDHTLHQSVVDIPANKFTQLVCAICTGALRLAGV